MRHLAVLFRKTLLACELHFPIPGAFRFDLLRPQLPVFHLFADLDPSSKILSHSLLVRPCEMLALVGNFLLALLFLFFSERFSSGRKLLLLPKIPKRIRDVSLVGLKVLRRETRFAGSFQTEADYVRGFLKAVVRNKIVSEFELSTIGIPAFRDSAVFCMKPASEAGALRLTLGASQGERRP